MCANSARWLWSTASPARRRAYLGSCLPHFDEVLLHLGHHLIQNFLWILSLIDCRAPTESTALACNQWKKVSVLTQVVRCGLDDTCHACEQVGLHNH
jgi:hypothetical protein